MKFRFISYIISFIVLSSCSSKSSTITVLCEQDARGNYLLKWEMYPEIDSALVEIFMSDNDSIFPSNASYTAHSNDYIAVIENTPENMETRKFFRVKIGKTISPSVSNRFFELDSIQNFRDLGGYVSSGKHRIHWGKIFRSGSFSRMTEDDKMELDKLGLKTIIDLRSKDAKARQPRKDINAKHVRIPISTNGYSSMAQKVLDGQFLRGDAIVYTQDSYRDMVTNFTKEYAEFFDYLCDENNYPLVYYCFLGKDQSGLATFFILKALDIPTDVIEEDYMASHIGINTIKSVKDADSLTESRQEAFTMLTKTDLAFLKYGISCIKEKHGSIEEYMLKELKITPEKKEKLKRILLTNYH